MAWIKSSGGDWNNSGLQQDITSYTITNLEPDTEYKVDVQVWDEADYWVWYGEKIIKTKQTADTEAPTAGTLTVGTVTTNSIALSWPKGRDDVTPQNKLRYNILWKKLPDEIVWKEAYASNYPVDITSYTITGLQSDTEYRVRATASNFE